MPLVIQSALHVLVFGILFSLGQFSFFCLSLTALSQSSHMDSTHGSVLLRAIYSSLLICLLVLTFCVL